MDLPNWMKAVYPYPLDKAPDACVATYLKSKFLRRLAGGKVFPFCIRIYGIKNIFYNLIRVLQPTFSLALYFH